MTDKQIQHTLEVYHRKAMREPTKRLRAAIEQASKKRCWYNGWKHEGQLADYGILYEPMREFLSKAQFGDICAMCEFLMARANVQIEKFKIQSSKFKSTIQQINNFYGFLGKI